VIVVPLLSITRMSNRKILALQKELHDRREQEFDTFVTSLEYLPELMESWTSLQDISSRVKADEE